MSAIGVAFLEVIGPGRWLIPPGPSLHAVLGSCEGQSFSLATTLAIERRWNMVITATA
jgi:hypothetical protein